MNHMALAIWPHAEPLPAGQCTILYPSIGEAVQHLQLLCAASAPSDGSADSAYQVPRSTEVALLRGPDR